MTAVIVVPTLTALILGGLRAESDLDHASALRHTVSQVRVAESITSLVHELQKERTLSVAWVASDKSKPRTELDTQTGVVDEAVTKAQRATENLDTDDEAAKQRYALGLQRLSVLDDIRDNAKGTAYPDVAVYTAYTSVLDAIVRLGREVNLTITDRELLDEGTVVQALSDAKENIAKENAILQIAAARHEFPADTLGRIRDAEASAASAIANFRANAAPDQLRLYSDTVAGPEVDVRQLIMAQAIASAEGTATPGKKASDDQGTTGGNNVQQAKAAKRVLAGIDRDELTTTGAVTLEHLREVETKLLGGMRGNAGDLAAAASRSAIQDAVTVLGVLLAALFLMALVTRSLLRPMRKLRREALEVAHRRLPATVKRILATPDPQEAAKHAVEPIAVFTREETGQVARAFDVVQEQAVLMATEQAVLRDNINSIFVNLSRRSQTLVERQLSLIDGLELDEQDPDQLATLFELDHLATRMRRYSESLLVLSGVGLSRQSNRTVTAADVVGAAVSEIEQYARIQVASAPDVAVQGRAVSDLVHLIAELLDNATFFSQPEQKVNVRMAVTRDRELGIQITDHGVGMLPDEIEVANRRLADPPDLDVAVTRRMGLYVVARLAKRHGIHVRLRENEDIDGGLIARITVPSELVQSSDRAVPAPSSSSFVSSEEPPSDLPSRSMDVGGDQAGGLGSFASASPEMPAELASVEPVPATLAPVESLSAEPPSFGEGEWRDDYYWQPGLNDPELNADTPADRLPIYEAMLSQWFSDDHASSQQAQDGADSGGEWDSPGDEGWVAAQALQENGHQATTTTAGLPKRVPKAYLVPGSAAAERRPVEAVAGKQPSAQATVPAPRHAEAVRGRMSRLQEGVQRGRHAAIEAHAEAGVGQQMSGQDEEQE